MRIFSPFRLSSPTSCSIRSRECAMGVGGWVLKSRGTAELLKIRIDSALASNDTMEKFLRGPAAVAS